MVRDEGPLVLLLKRDLPHWADMTRLAQERCIWLCSRMSDAAIRELSTEIDPSQHTFNEILRLLIDFLYTSMDLYMHDFHGPSVDFPWASMDYFDFYIDFH